MGGLQQLLADLPWWVDQLPQAASLCSLAGSLLLACWPLLLALMHSTCDTMLLRLFVVPAGSSP
jgi:hypothetical protein